MLQNFMPWHWIGPKQGCVESIYEMTWDDDTKQARCFTQHAFVTELNVHTMLVSRFCLWIVWLLLRLLCIVVVQVVWGTVLWQLSGMLSFGGSLRTANSMMREWCLISRCISHRNSGITLVYRLHWIFCHQQLNPIIYSFLVAGAQCLLHEHTLYALCHDVSAAQAMMLQVVLHPFGCIQALHKDFACMYIA